MTRAHDGGDARQRVERRLEGCRVRGEHGTRADQPGDVPDPRVVAALQRVGDADRRDRDARRHRAERHQQVVHAVAGEHQQRQARAEAPVEQRLSNGIGRRDRASVADRAPVTTGPFGYQRMFGSDPRPFPQAMHHRHRILAQFLGRAKQQLTRLAAVSGEDSRRREQIPDTIAAGHLALPCDAPGPGPAQRSTIAFGSDYIFVALFGTRPQGSVILRGAAWLVTAQRPGG